MAKADKQDDLLSDNPDAPPWEDRGPTPNPEPEKSPPLKRKAATARGEIRKGDALEYDPESNTIGKVETYTYPEPVVIAPSLSTNNAAKLERAKAHLDKLFSLAAAGLIDVSGKFYGSTSIEIAWVDGQAQEVLPTFSARDRVGR